MHIYNWYHSDITSIHMYMSQVIVHCGTVPLLLLSLLFIPLCSPFVSPHLLGTLLDVIGSVHLVPGLLVN